MDDDLHAHLAVMGRDHWWYRGRRRVLRSVLLDHLSANDDRSIIEIGAGTGSVTLMLTDLGRVIAVEPNDVAAEACRDLVPAATVLTGDLDHLDDLGQVRLQTFDLVCAFDVIEHLPDDNGALVTLRTLVSPSGLAAITVPALELLWGPHDVINGHYRRYSRTQLVRAVERAGFEVEYVSYFNTLLFPIVAAVRILRRLIPGADATPHSDFSMPPRIANQILTLVLGLEARLLRSRALPVGSSLVVLARPRSR